MKLINKKLIQILSDGSLVFSCSNIIKPKQIILFEKDNKNSHINKKKVKTKTKDFTNHKKKYLN
jgi:hypothetical protein